MNIALIGFGTVGQGLVEILRDKQDSLQQKHGFTPRVVAVATRSRGTLYHPDGLSFDELLSAIETSSLRSYPGVDGLQRDWDVMQIIEQSNAEVIVEASISNLETGQPATDYCLRAFEKGKHVTLANKGPAALAYDQLREAAQTADKQLYFEATVMAGTPSIRLAMEALAGCTISEVRGILNGTSNYILTQMERGMSYEDALSQAQELGYAEADPTADVEGWDAAGKILILAASLFGVHWKLDDLEVTGISQITLEDIEEAQAVGECWKLLASVTAKGGQVNPVRLAIDDPLAGVSGATNALTFSTDLMGEVTLIGAGAGRLETGFALLADLLAIHRS